MDVFGVNVPGPRLVIGYRAPDDEAVWNRLVRLAVLQGLDLIDRLHVGNKNAVALPTDGECGQHAAFEVGPGGRRAGPGEQEEDENYAAQNPKRFFRRKDCHPNPIASLTTLAVIFSSPMAFGSRCENPPSSASR